MYCVHIADREVQRILLELLNQMDGFDQSVNVKVLWKHCKVVAVCTVYTHACTLIFTPTIMHPNY